MDGPRRCREHLREPAAAPATAAYSAAPTSGNSSWMGLAIGLLVILVAFAAFEYGKRSAAPVIVLDEALVEALLERLQEPGGDQ